MKTTLFALLMVVNIATDSWAQRQTFVKVNQEDKIAFPFSFVDLRSAEIYQVNGSIFFELQVASLADSVDLSGTNLLDLDVTSRLNDSTSFQLSMRCFGPSSCNERSVIRVSDVFLRSCGSNMTKSISRNAIDYTSSIDSIDVSVLENKIRFRVDTNRLDDSTIASFKRNAVFCINYTAKSATCDKVKYSDFLSHRRNWTPERGLDSSGCPNKKVLTKDYTSYAILPFKERPESFKNFSNTTLSVSDIKIVDSLFFDWGSNLCVDLKRYRRQYIPLKNSNGETFVYVHAFCGDLFESWGDGWKRSLTVVFDYDECILELLVNATKKKSTNDITSWTD